MKLHWLAGAVAVCSAGMVAAQDVPAGYPAKPIRFIVPFQPGGGTDIVARLLADKLRASLGQTVIVDNRSGAGGIVGTQAAAKATPDGYTLLLGYTGSLTINPHINRELPYQPLRDFDPVSLAVSSPFLLVLNPSVPATTIAELIALAKKRPDPLNYGSSGNGSLHHLGMEWFKSISGINLVHVPYQGAQVFTAVISGEAALSFASVVGMLGNVKAGRARAIAITSRERTQLLPGVPTMIEAGVPGFEAANWFGVVVPHGTPRGVVNRLSVLVQSYMNTEDMKKRLASEGGDPVGSTPEAFGNLIKIEHERWGRVVKISGAKVD